MQLFFLKISPFLEHKLWLPHEFNYSDIGKWILISSIHARNHLLQQKQGKTRSLQRSHRSSFRIWTLTVLRCQSPSLILAEPFESGHKYRQPPRASNRETLNALQSSFNQHLCEPEIPLGTGTYNAIGRYLNFAISFEFREIWSPQQRTTTTQWCPTIKSFKV